MPGQAGMSLVCPVVLVCLLSQSSGRGSHSPTRLSPIVLLPGDGGNRLDARREAGEAGEADWSRLWLDVWQLRRSRVRDWADTIKLVYNSETRRSSNVAGLETRVPGWGQTDCVEYLDPSWSAWLLGDVGNYMASLVQYFVALGYRRGETIRAAPYDFRLAPHSQAEYFRRLRALVEEMFSRAGSVPVTIISHSMGGLFGLYFLQQQSDHWLSRHVKLFIPLNTPWRGAVIQLNTYAR